MDYTIMIMRDENLILERKISADHLIDLLTSAPAEPKPEAPAPVRTKTAASAPTAKKGKRKCGNCGKPGHTARTCGDKEATALVAKRDPLTEEMFDQVKQLKEEGNMISSELALELAVPIREVNIAIFLLTYEDYLSKRKSDNVV